MSLFITLEGPEGGGKTTQLRRLAEWLQAEGYTDLLVTREPGGTAISEQIRNLVLDPAQRGLTPEAEILLYSASRAQLVNEVIRPALQRGAIVLCDRYADSTMAYQGYGRGLDLAALSAITAFATGGLRPHLTLLLDVDPAEGLSRRRDSGTAWNRLDAETLAFHQRVRQGYHALAATGEPRWQLVDASQGVDTVAAQVRAIVAARLPVQRAP